MSVDSYLKLAEGRLDVGSAYGRGEIKVDGDTQLCPEVYPNFLPLADTARKGGPPRPGTARLNRHHRHQNRNLPNLQHPRLNQHPNLLRPNRQRLFPAMYIPIL